MTRRKTSATTTTGSKALTVPKIEVLMPDGHGDLAAAVGSREAAARLSGDGGEVMREDGVVRVTGFDYVTTTGVVRDAEVFFDRAEKPREKGVWLGEADKVAWIDPSTGYECIMLRNRPDGYLSGYVGLPVGHPLHGWDHQAIPPDLGIEVHGGLTRSLVCQDGPSPERRLVVEARRICHVVVGTAPLVHGSDHRAGDGHWWFGFDCNHLYDVVPGGQRDRRFLGPETGAEYRDDGYVVREIRTLATQLRSIVEGRPPPPRNGPPLPAIGLDPDGAR